MPDALFEGGLGPSSPDRRRTGAFGTEGAPLALHLLETLLLLQRVGYPSLPARVRVVRPDLLKAAGDLERMGLVLLREVGESGGVWVSLSEASRRLLKSGRGRGVE